MPIQPIDRRRFLQVTGAAALSATVAGCADAMTGRDGADENVVLGPPEGHDRADPDRVQYPIYGEPIPDVTVPAPLQNREVTTTEFHGERHAFYTFVFTRCPGACPGLMGTLRHVQDDAIEEGYADEVAFLPITFDPAHDTPEVLAEYEETYGIEHEPGHWYTLRPEDETDAKAVVEEEFGCAFDPAEPDDDGENGHDEEMGHDDGNGHDEEDEGGHEMAFVHHVLLLLVNKDGYVERAYSGEVPTPGDVVEDTRAVVEGW
ncbi:SCO family protein [Natronobacterium texcoconense]|uniref:Protein SCO1/2 n=1 Tax=Natronobacterium texcoconense TaxID=1095778 RepID=A0A1H1IXH2_NATTX|nr:SCO family protein [Natronobacterium texcoconense]SDR42349.1 protein SCO1/2 [Natronobacterium texcoconense]